MVSVYIVETYGTSTMSVSPVMRPGSFQQALITILSSLVIRDRSFTGLFERDTVSFGVWPYSTDVWCSGQSTGLTVISHETNAATASLLLVVAALGVNGLRLIQDV